MARLTFRRPSRTTLLALTAGAAAALAHPPFGLLPGLLGYGLFLHLIDTVEGPRPLRAAFWRGWLVGAAYFGLGCWWVTEAFMVDIVRHGWMAPFALVVVSGGLALFWGAAAALYRRLAPAGWTRLLVFAGALALMEWLRGMMFFPWNLPGETWRAGSAPSQLASVIGAYGLTWVTLAIAAAPALLFKAPRARGARIVNAAALIGLIGLYATGAARMPAIETKTDGPLIRIVQADVKQAAKYDQAYFQDIVDRYVRLTAQPAARTPDIVIWPEGAIPAEFSDYMSEGAWTRGAILSALKPGQVLIVGGYRTAGTFADPVYFNSLFVTRRTAQGIDLLGVYDKHRLVPFGEFLPLEDLIEPLGIKQLVGVGDGFTPGPHPAPLAAPGVPVVQPLICYESLFPRYTRRGGKDDPAWIVNVSNDAWFGQTSGPWQHLNLASYRAIEEGLPLIRSTPTGISAIIDAYGRLIPNAQIKLGEAGVIDATLPRALERTLYSRYGDTVFWLLITFSLAFTVRQIVRSVKFA